MWQCKTWAQDKRLLTSQNFLFIVLIYTLDTSRGTFVSLLLHFSDSRLKHTNLFETLLGGPQQSTGEHFEHTCKTKTQLCIWLKHVRKMTFRMFQKNHWHLPFQTHKILWQLVELQLTHREKTKDESEIWKQKPEEIHSKTCMLIRKCQGHAILLVISVICYILPPAKL